MLVGLSNNHSTFFGGVRLGFELRAPHLQSKADVLLLKPHLQSILLWLFWWWTLENYLYTLPQTFILPISASGITDGSHRGLALPGQFGSYLYHPWIMQYLLLLLAVDPRLSLWADTGHAPVHRAQRRRPHGRIRGIRRSHWWSEAPLEETQCLKSSLKIWAILEQNSEEGTTWSGRCEWQELRQRDWSWVGIDL
jgi:hypothetical protein